MAHPKAHPDLTASSMTIQSDSENYGHHDSSASPPPSSSDSPLILYKPPTIWSLLRGAAINLFLPFVNGLMLGFGELFAHEIAFQLGWSGTKIFPNYRSAHRAGPGIQVQDDPIKRKQRGGELQDLTSLE